MSGVAKQTARRVSYAEMAAKQKAKVPAMGQYASGVDRGMKLINKATFDSLKKKV